METLMPKRVAVLAIFLAFQGFATLGEGAVLCVGDSGHQRIEVASAACCLTSPSGGTGGTGWSAESPCGPCVDFPYASGSLSANASRTQRDHEVGPLELTRICVLPEPLREVLARPAASGERLLSARASSPLRV